MNGDQAMVEYGVVVWIPAPFVQVTKKGLDKCYATTPEHKIVETINEALEFIRKYGEDVCGAKIYRVAGDNDLEEFCEEIDWNDQRCELLEEELEAEEDDEW